MELTEDDKVRQSVLCGGQWTLVNDVVLWLHGERERARLQKGLLERLKTIIPHLASMFDLCRTSEGRVECFGPEALGFSNDALEEYYLTYAAQDYTAWGFTPSRAIVYRDLDVIAPALRDDTSIYREWMEPQGLYYGMGCTIVQDGVIYGTVTLFRSREDGDFSREEVAMLAEIGKHLGVHFALLWPRGFSAADEGSVLEQIAREHGITGREQDVLSLMASGATNQDIAQALFISESTVKKHINALYRKLGVQNRVQFAQVVYAHEA